MSAHEVSRALAVVTFVALLAPSSAQGHAAYKDSDPPDESTVSSAPSEIWAEFTEPPAQGSTLSVFNQCGDRVDLGDSRVDAAAFRVYVSVESVHSGGFRVDFRVTSAYDSHVTTGSFTFTATTGEDCAGPPPGAGGNGGDGGNAAAGSGGDGSSSQPGADGEGSLEQVASISERGDAEDPGTDADDREGRSRQAAGAGEEEGTDGDIGAAAADPSPDTPSIWDGIAVGDLLIGFALSALIGAAGGKVYAGIVGPRR